VIAGFSPRSSRRERKKLAQDKPYPERKKLCNKGTASAEPQTPQSEESFVSGHGFSRAASAAK
jgi:hypothetical protein